MEEAEKSAIIATTISAPNKPQKVRSICCSCNRGLVPSSVVENLSLNIHVKVLMVYKLRTAAMNWSPLSSYDLNRSNDAQHGDSSTVSPSRAAW